MVVEALVGVVFVGVVLGVMGYVAYKKNKEVRDKVDEVLNRLDK